MDQTVLNAPDDEVLKNGRDPLSQQDDKRVNAKELKAQNNPSSAIGSQRLQPNWKNEPTVSELKKDLFNAKPSRDARVTKVDEWAQLLDGGKPIPKRRGRSQVRPKLVRRQAEWRYSALSEPFLSSEDVFQVNPRTYEDGPAASQNALLINWQFRTKMDIVRMIGEAVRTFVDEGTLILRAGWKRETEPEKVLAPIYQYTQIMQGTQEEEALQQALAIREQNPAQFEQLDPAIQESINYSETNGVTAWATKIGEEYVTQQKIIRNHPTVDIVDYRNVYLDPSCGNDPDKATFVVYSFETSKGELKRDKRYKNLGSVNYAGGEPIVDTEHGTETPQDFNFDDDDRKRVVAYEYWGMWDIHKDGNLQPIVATWIDDQMIRLETNPYPDRRHPFVFVQYSPIKKSVFGQPDAEMLSDNQAISGAVTRGMIDLLGRSANSQQGFQKGMLDVTNRRRFENGEDYEFNPSANPVQALIQHKYPEIPVSAMNLLQLQNNDAEALTGVKAFSGGLSAENYGKVAAGIQGVIDAAAKREMDILRRFAEGWKMIAMKIISMNRVFLSEKEVVRVTNTKFVDIRRDDLEGQFDLKLDISTPEIDERKAADLSFMLQTLGAVMPFEFTQKILYRIAKLRKMPELAQEILEFKPEPDPLEEAKKEGEVLEQQLKNEKTRAEIAEIQAKTEKLLAEADKIDYETELDASGVKHARDMEQQTEQARGNQDLVVTKALATPRKEGEGEFDLEKVLGFNTLTKNISNASNQPLPVLPPTQ